MYVAVIKMDVYFINLSYHHKGWLTFYLNHLPLVTIQLHLLHDDKVSLVRKMDHFLIFIIIFGIVLIQVLATKLTSCL